MVRGEGVTVVVVVPETPLWCSRFVAFNINRPYQVAFNAIGARTSALRTYDAATSYEPSTVHVRKSKKRNKNTYVRT